MGAKESIWFVVSTTIYTAQKRTFSSRISSVNVIKSAVLLQTWSNLLKKSLIKEPHFLCSAMLNKSVCKPSKVFPDVIINQKCSDISQKIFWDEVNFYESLCFYWKFFRKVLAVKQTPSKKCRYSKFFWSFLSRIGTEYGDLLCKSADLLCKSLYSVQAHGPGKLWVCTCFTWCLSPYCGRTFSKNWNLAARKLLSTSFLQI